MHRTWPLLALGALACEPRPMGVAEALDALAQVERSGRGDTATAEVIEVSTGFTIGAALADAARAIGEFWDSQAPCSTVTLDGPRVTVDYGTLADACAYHGHTYAGLDVHEVVSTSPGALEVLHTWEGFTNGEVRVDGGAQVTWTGTDRTWTVATDHTWSSVTDPTERVDVTGEHRTGPLEEGAPVWESGFTLDGTREWTSDGQAWSLAMTGLELRMVDPAPQAGTVDVTSPAGKTLTIEYARVDEDTISATLRGVRGGDRVFHLSPLGAVEEATP